MSDSRIRVNLLLSKADEGRIPIRDVKQSVVNTSGLLLQKLRPVNEGRNSAAPLQLVKNILRTSNVLQWELRRILWDFKRVAAGLPALLQVTYLQCRHFGPTDQGAPPLSAENAMMVLRNRWLSSKAFTMYPMFLSTPWTMPQKFRRM